MRLSTEVSIEETLSKLLKEAGADQGQASFEKMTHKELLEYASLLEYTLTQISPSLDDAVPNPLIKEKEA